MDNKAPPTDSYDQRTESNVDSEPIVHKFEKELKEFLESRTGGNKKDLEFFKTSKSKSYTQT